MKQEELSQMTYAQKTALARFDETNAGSLFFDGRWIFKQDIRDDADLARRFIGRIEFKSSGATRKR